MVTAVDPLQLEDGVLSISSNPVFDTLTLLGQPFATATVVSMQLSDQVDPVPLQFTTPTSSGILVSTNPGTMTPTDAGTFLVEVRLDLSTLSQTPNTVNVLINIPGFSTGESYSLPYMSGKRMITTWLVMQANQTMSVQIQGSSNNFINTGSVRMLRLF